MLDKDTGRKESRGDVVVAAFAKGGFFLPLGRSVEKSNFKISESYTQGSGP